MLVYANMQAKGIRVRVEAEAKLMFLKGKLFVYGPPKLQERFTAYFAEAPETKIDVDVRMVAAKDGSQNAPHHHLISVSEFPLFKTLMIDFFRTFLRQRTVYPNRLSFNLPYPGRKIQIKFGRFQAGKIAQFLNRCIFFPFYLTHCFTQP